MATLARFCLPGCKVDRRAVCGSSLMAAQHTATDCAATPDRLNFTLSPQPGLTWQEASPRFLEILLVIVHGAMKVGRRLDLGDDRAAKALGGFEARLGSAAASSCAGEWKKIAERYLRSDIRGLGGSVSSGRGSPKHIEELLIADLGGDRTRF